MTPERRRWFEAYRLEGMVAQLKYSHQGTTVANRKLPVMGGGLVRPYGAYRSRLHRGW